MTNRYFSDDNLQILLDSKAWRIVSSSTADVAPCTPPRRFMRWYHQHRERHAHPEVMISLSSGGYYGMGEDVYASLPGSVFCFAEREYHQFRYPVFAADADHLWFSLLDDEFVVHRVRLRAGKMSAQPYPERFERRGVAAAWRAFSAHASLRRLQIVGEVSAMVCMLVQKGYEPVKKDDTRTLQHDVIEIAVAQIEATAGKGISIERLARIAGYSPFHFSRVFKQQCGVTVHQYVDQCRRRRAKKLESEGYTKKAIGEDLGFSCPAAFSRWYRQAFLTSRAT